MLQRREPRTQPDFAPAAQHRTSRFAPKAIQFAVGENNISFTHRHVAEVAERARGERPPFERRVD